MPAKDFRERINDNFTYLGTRLREIEKSLEEHKKYANKQRELQKAHLKELESVVERIGERCDELESIVETILTSIKKNQKQILELSAEFNKLLSILHGKIDAIDDIKDFIEEIREEKKASFWKRLKTFMGF